MRTRDELLNEIEAERTAWQALLAEVGEARMEEPGPMGDWTFKDLAGHLAFWQERTLARIAAGPGGSAPPPAWPAAMGNEDEIEDWDEVNTWIREQDRDRPLRDVLGDADRTYERLATLIETMPEDDLMTPGRFDFMGGKALVEGQFFGHYYEEHEAGVREWLRTR